MKITLPILAAIALLWLPTHPRAQDFDMQGAQEACQDDVFALCNEAVPDHDRIEACLRKHWSKVSGKCRTFMSSMGKHRNANRRNCNAAGSAPSC